jgi:quercetin dioxygenase-like cupin family protein
VPFLPSEKMPTAEPLPGWKGRFWRSKQMSFAHHTITGGSTIHEHHHPNEEVWTVMSGELEVTIEDETAVAGPGDVAVVPPDAHHAIRALSGGTAVVANHPVREEFR